MLVDELKLGIPSSLTVISIWYEDLFSKLRGCVARIALPGVWSLNGAPNVFNEDIKTLSFL